jgi:hypothetical protein
MKSLPYWIQRADIASADFEPVDVAGALHAFTTHDWNAELDLLSELEGKASEFCPPGIGFVTPNGAILHVCPSQDGRALVHYHPAVLSKLLPFIPIRRFAGHTKQGVERSDVLELIQWFFEGRHEWLLRKLVSNREDR